MRASCLDRHPIVADTKESQRFGGDIVQHEVADGVTDEEVRMLDVVPKYSQTSSCGDTFS